MFSQIRKFCQIALVFSVLTPQVLVMAGANVLTYHNDFARTGLNTNETILTPATVASANFAKLFTYPVDGFVYGQPLFLQNVNIAGRGQHNVVFVATEHNTVYAFDADNSGASGGLLWQANLGPSAVTTIAGVFTNQNFGTRFGGAFTDIVPEVGITSTPVIDTNTGSIYVDAFTGVVEAEVTNYFHHIHALKITDGTEQPYSPVQVAASVPGVGVGSTNGRVYFEAKQQLQRSALTLAGGILYVAYASFASTDPYHGWIIGYRATDLQLLTNYVFNTTPNSTAAQFGSNAGEGGIWMSGNGLAVDAKTNLYFLSGNGVFNVTNNSGNTEYADSCIKLSTTNGLRVADYFTPWDQEDLETGDRDFGSSGMLLLPDQTGLYPHLLLAGSKNGVFYMINRDQFTINNAHFNPAGGVNSVLQTASGFFNSSFGTPAYFNGRIYFAGVSDYLRSYAINNGQMTSGLISGARTYAYPGATPSISANGTANGIVWVIRRANPALLVASDASTLAEIYTSTNVAGGRDSLGNGVKFAVPTVANGKVFVTSQFSLSVYGLATYLATPVINPSGGIYANSAYVSISESTPDATIYYTLDGSAPTTGSTLYTGQFEITSSTLIQARAFKAGAFDSDIASADITVIHPISDTNNPTCTILKPTAGQRWSNDVFVVTGSAEDDQAVANVYYNVNNTGWNSASTSDGWNNWSAEATLRPGTNTIDAYAVDASGNESIADSVKFVLIAHGLMQVSFDTSRGSVAPNYNNTLLQIGVNFAMTATPKAGFSFTNWMDGNGMVVTNKPTIKFEMLSGLALTANFVDSIKPTVSITNLPITGIVSNRYFTILGKASDNARVANVYYNIGSLGWNSANSTNGFTNWSGFVSLDPGTNLIVVSASDVAGNSSSLVTNRLIYVLSSSITFRTNGTGGSIAPNYNNARLQIGMNYLVTATPKAGFAFTNWTTGNGAVVTNQPALRFTMASNLVFSANFVDITKPLVSITSLPINGVVSNNYFSLQGKASDNVSVANVYYNLNNTGWNSAISTNNWTNWTGLVNLKPGTNFIGISAKDDAGNYSLSNSVRLVYVVSGVLRINTNGIGNISPVANGALLQIGKDYALTATPGAGFVFSNWTDATSNPVTNKPTLKFMMASNLLFTARFIDISKPVLGVFAPLATTLATAEFFKAYGKATDNAGIATVRYQLNGGGWYPADTTNNWTNWWVVLDLTPGTNYFATYTLDTSGNLSPTNLTKFIYQTAPASLAGLKAQVTPDGSAVSYEMAFGAGVFSQSSSDLNNINGVGVYTYSKLTPNAGLLKATFTTPPKATNDANAVKRSLSLFFETPSQARFTNTNNASTGGITFTSTPAWVPPNLVNQTLINVNDDGTGDSTRFTTVQSITSGLSTHVTNSPRSYVYYLYSPLTALVRQIGTNGVSYILATMRGTNYGETYSEKYTLAGSITGTNQGVFGLASQRLAGNAPTNLVNRSALVSSVGDSFRLSFGTNSFTQLNPADSSLVEGSGNYIYARVSTNAGNLNLNYVSPPQNSAALFQFAAPNFAVFTNLDTTLGTAIFK